MEAPFGGPATENTSQEIQVLIRCETSCMSVLWGLRLSEFHAKRNLYQPRRSVGLPFAGLSTENISTN